MNDDIPEPWHSAMLDAGLIDGRTRRNPRPSYRALATAVGVSTTTITRMVAGDVDTGSETVAAVARRLGRTPVEVSQWVNQARSVVSDWTPPAAVHELTEREQRALTELIMSMAAAKRKAKSDDSAPMNRAPVSGDLAVTQSEVAFPREAEGDQPPSQRQRRRR